MQCICRNCSFQLIAKQIGVRCPKCSSTRLINHPELNSLYIAHVDCDAFYASVEKRDNPKLNNKPVIVGGNKRGVVAACCYIARIKGVHSAMPIYKALEACPNAEVITPNMEKYTRVGQQIKKLMRQTTPLVESISIDEAFIDLTGTEKINNGNPAKTLINLTASIEKEIGITASVGLSYNKFLAKTASDIDKPRGFSIIGKTDALSFLEPLPVGSIWGVGKSIRSQLEKDGLSTIGELREITEQELTQKYGKIGKRLFYLARGEDNRTVQADTKAKNISAETTFPKNLQNLEDLLHRLWPLCEKVSNQLKNRDLAAGKITIKLKTSRFKILSRSHTLQQPTKFAEVLYQTSKTLLKSEANGTSYRLIGIGVSAFVDPKLADQPDLLGNSNEHIAKIEDTLDIVRKKFGAKSIKKGRNFLIN